jgi:hypothetical protein
LHIHAANGEAWRLEDVRVIESSKPASLHSPSSDGVSSEADSAKWTLVSRLLADSQPPRQPSSSGRSTPSNLERAVLLLESEGAELPAGQQAQTHPPATSAKPDSIADEELSHAAPAAAAAAAKTDGVSSLQAIEQDPAELDLAAKRSTLRKLSTAVDADKGAAAEEGPATPSKSMAPAQSNGGLKQGPETPSSGEGDLVGIFFLCLRCPCDL